MVMILEFKLCILFIKSKKGDPKRVGGNDMHSHIIGKLAKWKRRLGDGMI